MFKTFFLALCFVASQALCQAGSVTFPQGYIPFTSIYYQSGPDQNGYSIVEGVLMTGNQNGALFNYLSSLPAISGAEAYTNQSIELAPGMFFSDVLVPTFAERAGNFQDFGGEILDPYNGGQPFAGNEIPASLLFSPFAFRIGPSTGSDAPEPSTLLPFGLALFGAAKLASRYKNSRLTSGQQA